MYDRVNGDGPYGHVIKELRLSVMQQAVRQIEQERDRRRGLASKPRKRRKIDEGNRGLHAAFARAAREQRELQRLKGSGRPYAALDFEPDSIVLLAPLDYEEDA